MRLSTENVEITPEQCRGARGILDLSQPALASKANLGLSTVIDFERSRRPVSARAIGAIRAALERAGVVFVQENGDGPGVRLKKTKTR